MNAPLEVGRTIRTIVEHPAGHTRLPRYARGRVGRIEAVHGEVADPGVAASGVHPAPRRRFYTVAFPGDELWGADAELPSTVLLEVFEHQLEPVDLPTEREETS